MHKFWTITKDVVTLSGAGLILSGVWWIYQPACLIVGGAALLYVTFLIERKSSD